MFAIALLLSGGYGVKYILDQKEDIENSRIRQQELMTSSQQKAKQITENIKRENQNDDNKTNVHRDFTELKKKNSDTVAWLTVPGTDIDMPIVKGENNTYYLTHDFDKNSNAMGWAFADSQNTFPTLSTNTIMYGHTYRMTTIFSKLKNVLSRKWLDNESMQRITLDTEKERLIFKVFSVYTIKETADYLQINFDSREKYQEYLNTSLKRSIKDFKTLPTVNNKIITLSTCYQNSNQRLIVQAKLIGSE
ncbi:MAG: class B sortase [Bacilli bacterium]|nr:class B sortase [Bacilli bacterium]